MIYIHFFHIHDSIVLKFLTVKNIEIPGKAQSFGGHCCCSETWCQKAWVLVVSKPSRKSWRTFVVATSSWRRWTRSGPRRWRPCRRPSRRRWPANREACLSNYVNFKWLNIRWSWSLWTSVLPMGKPSWVKITNQFSDCTKDDELFDQHLCWISLVCLGSSR